MPDTAGFLAKHVNEICCYVIEAICYAIATCLLWGGTCFSDWHMPYAMQKSKIGESTYDMLMYMRYANVLATGSGNASGEWTCRDSWSSKLSTCIENRNLPLPSLEAYSCQHTAIGSSPMSQCWFNANSMLAYARVLISNADSYVCWSSFRPFIHSFTTTFVLSFIAIHKGFI